MFLMGEKNGMERIKERRERGLHKNNERKAEKNRIG